MTGRAYRSAALILSALLVILGGAIVVRTILLGGEILSFGLIFGVLVTALGLGRLYIAYRGTQPR